MAFSDVLQSLGRLIGLYSDEDASFDESTYDEYEQPEGQYEEPAQQDEPSYQSGYGSGGGSYVRAGARPVEARKPIVEPTPGLFNRTRQTTGQTQYRPDNVIPMPEREDRSSAQSVRPSVSASTIIFCVRRKDDSSQIINYLLSGVNVILNFEEVDDVQCQRVLDMVSGAAFALRGTVERISHRNYLVAPTGVEIVRSETQGREERDRERYKSRSTYLAR